MEPTDSQRAELGKLAFDGIIPSQPPELDANGEIKVHLPTGLHTITRRGKRTRDPEQPQG